MLLLQRKKMFTLLFQKTAWLLLFKTVKSSKMSSNAPNAKKDTFFWIINAFKEPI